MFIHTPYGPSGVERRSDQEVGTDVEQDTKQKSRTEIRRTGYSPIPGHTVQ